MSGCPRGISRGLVIDAVAQPDLTSFYVAYGVDGHGRAVHDPAMMVALLLYAYAALRGGLSAAVWSMSPRA